MNCPKCKKEFHFKVDQEIVYDDNNGLPGITGFVYQSAICPSCSQYLLYRVDGIYVCEQSHTIFSEYIQEPYNSIELLYPIIGERRVLSNIIPKNLRDDFSEASIVLKFSPKASAALSRRCLQNFIHTHLEIKERSLAKEIEKFIESERLPSYLLSALDAIRNIGNFAAHPLKDTNTGEIVEVEAGEADWLLDVLELVFDFYFIQPNKYEEKKMKLNQKLESLGKPTMK